MNDYIVSKDSVVEVLNLLTQTCRTSAQVFKQAAGRIVNQTLSTLLHTYSLETEAFADELRQTMRELSDDEGHDDAVDQAAEAPLAKAHVEGDEKLIKWCEKAARSSRKTYEDALRAHMPYEFESLIRSQYARMNHAYRSIAAMRPN